MSGAGDPVMKLQGSEAASEKHMSGAGDPLMRLQGSEAASERWAPGETPEDRT